MTKQMRAAALAAAAAVAGFAPAAPAQDAAKGKTVFESRCIACHSLAANRVGPALGTVFGRTAGTNPGFAYSPALKAAGHVWDAEALEKWLVNPQAFVPGAAMPFRLGDAEERRNVVAYFRSLKK
jgi:cytochrome c